MDDNQTAPQPVDQGQVPQSLQPQPVPQFSNVAQEFATKAYDELSAQTTIRMMGEGRQNIVKAAFNSFQAPQQYLDFHTKHPDGVGYEMGNSADANEYNRQEILAQQKQNAQTAEHNQQFEGYNTGGNQAAQIAGSFAGGWPDFVALDSAIPGGQLLPGVMGKIATQAVRFGAEALPITAINSAYEQAHGGQAALPEDYISAAKGGVAMGAGMAGLEASFGLVGAMLGHDKLPAMKQNAVMGASLDGKTIREHLNDSVLADPHLASQAVSADYAKKGTTNLINSEGTKADVEAVQSHDALHNPETKERISKDTGNTVDVAPIASDEASVAAKQSWKNNVMSMEDGTVFEKDGKEYRIRDDEFRGGKYGKIIEVRGDDGGWEVHWRNGLNEGSISDALSGARIKTEATGETSIVEQQKASDGVTQKILEEQAKKVPGVSDELQSKMDEIKAKNGIEVTPYNRNLDDGTPLSSAYSMWDGGNGKIYIPHDLPANQVDFVVGHEAYHALPPEDQVSIRKLINDSMSDKDLQSQLNETGKRQSVLWTQKSEEGKVNELAADIVAKNLNANTELGNKIREIVENSKEEPKATQSPPIDASSLVSKKYSGAIEQMPLELPYGKNQAETWMNCVKQALVRGGKYLADMKQFEANKITTPIVGYGEKYSGNVDSPVLKQQIERLSKDHEDSFKWIDRVKSLADENVSSAIKKAANDPEYEPKSELKGFWLDNFSKLQSIYDLKDKNTSRAQELLKDPAVLEMGLNELATHAKEQLGMKEKPTGKELYNLRDDLNHITNEYDGNAQKFYEDKSARMINGLMREQVGDSLFDRLMAKNDKGASLKSILFGDAPQNADVAATAGSLDNVQAKKEAYAAAYHAPRDNFLMANKMFKDFYSNKQELWEPLIAALRGEKSADSRINDLADIMNKSRELAINRGNEAGLSKWTSKDFGIDQVYGREEMKQLGRIRLQSLCDDNNVDWKKTVTAHGYSAEEDSPKLRKKIVNNWYDKVQDKTPKGREQDVFFAKNDEGLLTQGTEGAVGHRFINFTPEGQYKIMSLVAPDKDLADLYSRGVGRLASRQACAEVMGPRPIGSDGREGSFERAIKKNDVSLADNNVQLMHGAIRDQLGIHDVSSKDDAFMKARRMLNGMGQWMARSPTRAASYAVGTEDIQNTLTSMIGEGPLLSRINNTLRGIKLMHGIANDSNAMMEFRSWVNEGMEQKAATAEYLNNTSVKDLYNTVRNVKNMNDLSSGMGMERGISAYQFSRKMGETLGGLAEGKLNFAKQAEFLLNQYGLKPEDITAAKGAVNEHTMADGTKIRVLNPWQIADKEVGNKVLTMINDLNDKSWAQPTAFSRRLANLNTEEGTMVGEFVRNAGQFTSFPVSTMRSTVNMFKFMFGGKGFSDFMDAGGLARTGYPMLGTGLRLLAKGLPLWYANELLNGRQLDQLPTDLSRKKDREILGRMLEGASEYGGMMPYGNQIMQSLLGVGKVPLTGPAVSRAAAAVTPAVTGAMSMNANKFGRGVGETFLKLPSLMPAGGFEFKPIFSLVGQTMFHDSFDAIDHNLHRGGESILLKQH